MLVSHWPRPSFSRGHPQPATVSARQGARARARARSHQLIQAVRWRLRARTPRQSRGQLRPRSREGGRTTASSHRGEARPATSDRGAQAVGQRTSCASRKASKLTERCTGCCAQRLRLQERVPPHTVPWPRQLRAHNRFKIQQPMGCVALMPQQLRDQRAPGLNAMRPLEEVEQEVPRSSEQVSFGAFRSEHWALLALGAQHRLLSSRQRLDQLWSECDAGAHISARAVPNAPPDSGPHRQGTKALEMSAGFEPRAPCSALARRLKVRMDNRCASLPAIHVRHAPGCRERPAINAQAASCNEQGEHVWEGWRRVPPSDGADRSK